jgi:glutaredoxin
MEFTIYSKPGCTYCIKVEQVLKAVNATYNVKKLHTDFNRAEFNSKFGTNATFPQIIVDGDRVGGCNETIKYLKENKVI